MWRASILTLFPGMFPGPLGLSLAGDALARGAWGCEAHDIRDHGLGRHRTVDDRPAGGGPGMVMRADVVAAALDAQPADGRPRLVMSPRGRPLTQAQVRGWAAGPGLVVLCGRFEGIDERIIAARDLVEVSVGDYVLSGGELAALVLLDACVRLLPGVMGAEASGHEESFEAGLLEYPQYTRPRDFEGRPIPDVLLGGDHGRIAAWRRQQAERLTAERRPDLVRGHGETQPGGHSLLPSREKVDRAIGARRMRGEPAPASPSSGAARHLLPRGEKGGASESQEGLGSAEHAPPFARDFEIEAAEADAIAVRHRTDGHWWRFERAEKNGRWQLVHAAHRAGPGGPAPEAVTVDAYDAATREARRRGMVD